MIEVHGLISAVSIFIDHHFLVFVSAFKHQQRGVDMIQIAFEAMNRSSSGVVGRQNKWGSSLTYGRFRGKTI